MAKKLVIVESPTKVKSISKYLGSDYIVKASVGHVRDLPKSRLGVEIKDDFKPTYTIISKSKKVIADLKKAAQKSDSLYLAPDPDREGEAIAWHLAEILTKDKKLKVWRVSFNEITQDAVRAAFKKPSRIDYDKVDAQQTRRILDRIVGYKLSPLLWKKVRGGLSAGRVQSVAVRLLCERQEEIDGFKPQEYWSIDARLKQKTGSDKEFTAQLDKLDNKKIKIESEKQAEKVVESLKDKDFKVQAIKKSEKKRNPYPPFSTSLLQQAAINKLGFTAHKTMFAAQKLYEGIEIGEEGGVGLITYMRTDSFRIAKDAQIAARKYIEKTFGSEFVPPNPHKYKSRKSAQGAHEAIRPTSLERTPESIKKYLTPDQLKLYTLIWERFLASQMASARIAVTSILIEAGNAIFKVSGSEVIFPGFLKIAQENEDENNKNKLPVLTKGEELALLELIKEQHFTKPPPYYNEATLVRALEENGIGRPSTYAPIIYTIIQRGYVCREQRKLCPTELGKHVNSILVDRFGDILNVEFTAEMESELDEVEKGKLVWTKVLKDFYTPFIKDLDKAFDEMERMPLKPIPTDQKCPKCDKPLVIRFGRYGQFLACSAFPKCKHTEALGTDVKCPEPECGGSLVHRRSGKGRSFYGCSNYPKCKFTTNSLKKYKNIEEENIEEKNIEEK